MPIKERPGVLTESAPGQSERNAMNSSPIIVPDGTVNRIWDRSIPNDGGGEPLAASSATAKQRPNAPASVNHFRRLWGAGYKRLVPIAQPGCVVSPTSSMFRRPKDVGKVPSDLGPTGWRGLRDWQNYEATEADLDSWHEMGAGIGIKTGAGLLAVDIDTLDEALAEKCERAAIDILGLSARRVGRAPKVLRVYRISETIPYQRIAFEGGVVEMLTDGKQFVAHGTHPGTLKPYTWPKGVPSYSSLPVITAQQVSAYLAELARILPAAKVDAPSSPKERQHIDPATLAGAAKDIRRALEALPNNFDDRETYRNVGQAIRGALPDDPVLGFDLFDEWAAKWPGYDADNTAADWRRFKPSHSLGAGYIFSLAEQHSDGAFAKAEVWFSGAPAGKAVDLNPFEEIAQGEMAAGQPAAPAAWADRLKLEPITDDEWRSSRPQRPCIVDNWFYEDVGHLAAPGGVGKTTLLLFQAVHIALGRDLFGQPVRRAGPVVFLTAEDDRGTMVARLRNMCTELGLAPAEIDTVRRGVFVLDVSGSGFKLTRVDGEVVVPGAGAAALAEALKPIKPTMLFIDPAVSFGVGESRVNDAEQGLIDAARLIRNEVGCGVIFVHHSGKENARNKTVDQYSGRGGSALADGSRTVHVMQSLTAEEWAAATGDTLHQGESGVVYARPKITWAPPNQPPLYLKRKGYLFERFDSISNARSAHVQLERNVEEVFAFLRTKISEGVRYSRTSIEDADVLKTRQARRAAVRHLIANGRIAEEATPAGARGRPLKLLAIAEGQIGP